MTDLNDESILNALAYPLNEGTLAQARRIRENTPRFDQISKHVIALHERLKHTGAFVAMSNSENHYKIKVEGISDALAKEAEEEIGKWAEKYKVHLAKVEGKPTYYIQGAGE